MARAAASKNGYWQLFVDAYAGLKTFTNFFNGPLMLALGWTTMAGLTAGAFRIILTHWA